MTDEILERALGLVGEILSHQKSQQFHLVVCGGSALVVDRMVSRTTNDVDVLASFNYDRELCVAYPLPQTLKQAAQEVAIELDLQPNWLNGDASLFFPDLHQLPQWFWQNVTSKEYHDYLRVDFISRRGLILLKTYAALNRAELRDFSDLKALAPSPTEIEFALKWVMGNCPVLENPTRLPELFRYLGHD